MLCDGDLRQGITLLQTTLRFATPANEEGLNGRVKITRENLDEMATVVPEKYETDLINAVKKRDFDAMKSTITVSVSAIRFI